RRKTLLRITGISYGNQQERRLFDGYIFGFAQTRGKGMLCTRKIIHGLHELTEYGFAFAVLAVTGHQARKDDAEERETLGFQLDHLPLGVGLHLRSATDKRPAAGR